MNIWTDEHDDLTASCTYDEAAHRYEVVVSSGAVTETTSFLATHEPVFGPDVADLDHSYMLAEQLAMIVDKKTGKT